ncbi:Tyrosine-protein phosphatase 3 [Cucumispora dikerogammari]|nr:Tyrosine-protein phosphatase 3 [Cucumispora dikerogammari]
MRENSLEKLNDTEREKQFNRIKPQLKTLFLKKKYNEFNYAAQNVLKEFILPQQKYDRFAEYTPYTTQVTSIYNLPQYVNASFVLYAPFRNYTCCMNPKEEHAKAFEDFLYYTKTELIITLNNVGTDGKHVDKSDFDYFSNIAKFNKIKEFIIPEILVDETYIYLKDTKFERQIQRIRFLKWGDFGVPKLDEFMEFFNYYLEVQKNYSSRLSSYCPTVVHCRAGVGRTGTFVCFDIVNEILKQKKKKSNKNEILNIIFDVLYEVKLRRIGMVQTADQISWLVEYMLQTYS